MSNDFISVDEVFDRLKDILSRTKKGKVKDQDVADLLGISIGVIYNHKKRDTLPLKQILHLCYRTGLDPMNILF